MNDEISFSTSTTTCHLPHTGVWQELVEVDVLLDVAHLITCVLTHPPGQRGYLVCMMGGQGDAEGRVGTAG
jgi:hypothetical protein